MRNTNQSTGKHTNGGQKPPSESKNTKVVYYVGTKEIAALKNQIDSLKQDIGKVSRESQEHRDEVKQYISVCISEELEKLARGFAEKERQQRDNKQRDNDFIRNKLKNILDSINLFGEKDEKSLQRETMNIKKILENNVNTIQRLIEESAKKQANDLSEHSDDIQDRLDELPKITGSVEVCAGKLKQLDSIQKILSDKNIDIKQTFPASNHDEETIMQMAEYGRIILQQMETAARWYARRKQDFEGIDQERQHHAEELRSKIEEARNQGIHEGKRQFIFELISKYDEANLSALFEADEVGALNRNKTLAAFLRNQGIEEVLKRGDIHTITDNNLEEYRILINHAHIGTVRITSPAYVLSNQVIAKAFCEDVVDHTNEIGTPDSIDSLETVEGTQSVKEPVNVEPIQHVKEPVNVEPIQHVKEPVNVEPIQHVKEPVNAVPIQHVKESVNVEPVQPVEEPGNVDPMQTVNGSKKIEIVGNTDDIELTNDEGINK